MTTTRKELGEWFDKGREQGYHYMIVKTDTFDGESYPDYRMDRVQAEKAIRIFPPATIIDEVYALQGDRASQLNARRAWSLSPSTEPVPKIFGQPYQRKQRPTHDVYGNPIRTPRQVREASEANGTNDLVSPLVRDAVPVEEFDGLLNVVERLLERVNGIQKRLDRMEAYTVKLKAAGR